MTKREINKIKKHLKALIGQRTITTLEQNQINDYYEKAFSKKPAAIRCGSKLRARILKIYNEIK